MNKIVIVEDDAVIRNELALFLTNQKYLVETFESIENVEDLLTCKPNLILLDVNLEGMDGYSICKKLRKKSDVPIIIVTSRNSVEDEVYSMQSEADDFISKPYHLSILLARMERILNRSSNQGTVIMIDDIEIDIHRQVVSKKDKSVELTKIEFRILYCLWSQRNTVVTRDTIMRDMWDSNSFVDDSALTVNMNRLRKKLEQIGVDNLIQTKRKEGYVLYE